MVQLSAGTVTLGRGCGCPAPSPAAAHSRSDSLHRRSPAAPAPPAPRTRVSSLRACPGNHPCKASVCPLCAKSRCCHPQHPVLAPARGSRAVWVLWACDVHLLQNLPPQKQLCLTPTSDFPSRSRLEMSKTPPVAAVSTPPVPRFCSRRFSRILGKRLSWCPEKVSVLSGTISGGAGALQPSHHSQDPVSGIITPTGCPALSRPRLTGEVG